MVGLRTHDSDYGARRKNLNRHRRRKNTKKKEENFSRSFRRKITPKKLDFQTAINAHLSLRRSHKLALHLGFDRFRGGFGVENGFQFLDLPPQAHQALSVVD